MLRRALLALGLLVLMAGTVFAFAFGIDTPSFHLKTSPGETKDNELVVYNQSNSDLNILVSVEDWKYRENRTKQFLKKGTSQFSCGNWIEPEETSFVLAAGQKRKFHFKLRTPQNADGGHQAVLFFEGIPAGSDDAAVKTKKGKPHGGVVIIGKIGALIYQETTGKTKASGEIIDLFGKAQGDNVLASVKFKNTGNTWLEVQGNVVAIDEQGMTIGRGDLAPIKILPGETVLSQIKVVFENTGITGRPKLLATLDYGEELLVKETPLSLAGVRTNYIPPMNEKVVTAPLKIAKQVTPAAVSAITKFSIVAIPEKKLVKIFVKLDPVKVDAAAVKGTVHIYNSKGVVVKTIALEKPASVQAELLLTTSFNYGKVLRKGKYTSKAYVKSKDKLFVEKTSFVIKP